jgi:hypothetical protein
MIKMQQIDRPTSIGLLPLLVKAEDPPATQVRLIVRAYNRAVQDVYGTPGKVFLPEIPERSKLFPKLKDAADVLAEHGIPPYAWAIWVLQHSKDRDVRASKSARPLYILAVFGAQYIAKRRGWFRKTTEHSYGHALKVERVHLEQLYRRQEYDRRQRGMTAPLMFLPPWYADIRKTEIAQGHEDPMVCFPRARSTK